MPSHAVNEPEEPMGSDVDMATYEPRYMAVDISDEIRSIVAKLGFELNTVERLDIWPWEMHVTVWKFTRNADGKLVVKDGEVTRETHRFPLVWSDPKTDKE